MNDIENNDLYIFELIKNGNQHAFERLFYKYSTPISRFINTFVKNNETAEDITLDLFSLLWEKRNTVEIKYSVKSYLFRSARNMTLNYLRDNRKELRVELEVSLEQDDSNNHLDTEDLFLIVEEAIMALPQRCKNIFVLSRHEYVSNKDIAQQLNLSVRTVETQIAIAIKKIKTFVQRIDL